MSIQATTNNPSIDWSTLLGKLDAATKAAGAQGASGVTAGQNVTITATVDGAQHAVTFPVPDDLPLPATVDQAAIDSLCAKLAGDTSLGLTEADIKAVHKALSGALAAIAPSITQGSKNVMFDLYKLMALLVEVGQKQRDATREIRSAQSQLVQKSIQDQADNQRLAAFTGMILGAITCGIQVAVSIVMLKSQTKDFNKQIKTLETSGVASAKENLSMLKAADGPAKADAQLQKVTAAIGNKPSNQMGRTIADDVGEFGFGATDQAKAKLQLEHAKADQLRTRLTNLASKSADGTLRSGDVPAGPLRDALLKQEAFEAKLAECGLSKQDADAYIELSQKDAQGLLDGPPVDVQGRAKLMSLISEHPNIAEMGLGNQTSAQIKAEIATATDAMKAELQNQIQTQSEAIDAARKNIRTAVKTDLQRYEDEYDAALRDVNSIDDKTTKAEVEQLHSKLQIAADKLKYARAYAYKELAQPGVTTPAERAADIRVAGLAVDSAEHGRTTDVEYLKATRSLQKGEAKLSIVNALGNAGQNLVQNLSSFLQAKSKDLEAEATRVQDELDQTKELFNQAQQLVDAVVQLMQAVTSAETQSMRDAIQA